VVEKEKAEGQNHGNEKGHRRERPTREGVIEVLKETELTIEAEEGVGGGADLLLHCKVVIQGDLLHPCHQAFICVHCSRKTSNSSSRHVIYNMHKNL